MEVLTANQIREWDQYTIAKEPITSLDLMERAATSCFNWICSKWEAPQHFTVFCGKGNNGGDGLAIARMLHKAGYEVGVNILEFGYAGTSDFQANLALLHELNVHPRFISSDALFPHLPENTVIIDALLGTGLNRPVDGLTAELIEWINHSGKEVIAIDIPSGLAADKSSEGNIILRADYTLSFQCYKYSFLFPENEHYTGKVIILDIGLLKPYLNQLSEDRPVFTSRKMVRSLFQPVKEFSHKGNFGHALIIAGSKGKTGAAVLAAKACVHSGAGLVTAHVPGDSLSILQSSVPEAMVIPDKDKDICSTIEYDLDNYKAIGIGPGLGTGNSQAALLRTLLTKSGKPLVIDADALNIFAADKSLLELVPEGSVITPHVKEFERLFGTVSNGFERLEKAKEVSVKHQINIILKGKFSAICCRKGRVFFNPTGNPGMASGGTGDSLTGIVTAFIANGVAPDKAAMAAAYIHGLAGDMAASELSGKYLSASVLISYLGKAFLDIEKDDV